MTLLIAIFLIGWSSIVLSQELRPNMFLIMVDDMGFDDISLHGSDQIPTPNIDAILSYGISLTRYYSAPMCTPARASLLTGKYPSSVGMQHGVILNHQPYGLSLNEKLLPEYFKDAGYDTHLVGKWHLGHYEERRTPIRRGFDSFFGSYGGFIDYYNHTSDCLGAEFPCTDGHDLRENVTSVWDHNGIYATTLFTDMAIEKINNHNIEKPLFMYLPYTAPHAGYPTDPLQVPEETVRRFSYISDPDRRRYAAMVSVMDDSVGRLVRAIEDKGILDNSIIVFLSDNGAPMQGVFNNSGSNFPFRAQKNSPFEGAVRVTGGIWSPYLESKQRTSNQLMHISDWLPTLTAAAGITLKGPIDGYNMWPVLSQNAQSPRDEVLLNVDSLIPYSSFIHKQWKYINGTTDNGQFDGWLSEEVDRSERDDTLQDYGLAVASSRTGQALSRFSRSETVWGKLISWLSNLLGRSPPRMHPSEINSIRQQSQITCNGVAHPSDPVFQCNPLEGACVFDILSDPCERRNLISQQPYVEAYLEKRLRYFTKFSQAPRNTPSDPCSNPAFFNDSWSSWYDLPCPTACSTTKSVSLTDNPAIPRDLYDDDNIARLCY